MELCVFYHLDVSTLVERKWGGNELDSGSRDCGKSSPNKDASKNMQSQRCLYVKLSVQMLGKERLILLILT